MTWLELFIMENVIMMYLATVLGIVLGESYSKLPGFDNQCTSGTYVHLLLLMYK